MDIKQLNEHIVGHTFMFGGDVVTITDCDYTSVHQGRSISTDKTNIEITFRYADGNFSSVPLVKFIKYLSPSEGTATLKETFPELFI